MRYPTILGVLAVMSAALAPTLAWSQDKPATTPKVVQCAKDKLIIGTGSKGGTYARMFKSLAPFCDMVCEDDSTTQGGYDNIMNVAVNETFDGGIVQADLLEFLNRSEPNIKKNVRSLFSLHGSSLHIFTPVAGVRVVGEKTVKTYMGISSEKVATENFVVIKSLSDLKGKSVAAWSSAVVTATIISERLKLDLDIVEVKTRPEGLKMLAEGKVFAFMGMGGKPLDWVEGTDGAKADIGKDLTMINVGTDEIGRLGAPYYSEQVTYRSINAIGIRTITVRNELVIRNIQRGLQLSAVEGLKACFTANLEDIQATRGKHPSWSDVSLENPLVWEPYKSPASAPARANVQQVAPVAAPAPAALPAVVMTPEPAPAPAKQKKK